MWAHITLRQSEVIELYIPYLNTVVNWHYHSRKCNSGPTQNCPRGLNTTTELKNVTTTSSNTGTLFSCNIPH